LCESHQWSRHADKYMSPRIPTSIRRIFREEDTKEIFRLQQDAEVFKRHYPDHDRWLRKAVEEVLSGDRTAFGAYVIDTVDSPSTLRLVGTCILKPPDLSSTVEIKNLYVEPDCRKMGCGTMLYKEVEEYCGRSGATRIRVELPGGEIDTLAWLLSKSFRLSHTRTSTYMPSDITYYLEKILPPYYQGDWFDDTALAKWVVTHLYGFKITDSESEPSEIYFEQSQLFAGVFPKRVKLPVVKGRVFVLGSSRSRDFVEFSRSNSNDHSNLLVLFVENKALLSSLSVPPQALVIDKETIHSLHLSTGGGGSRKSSQADGSPRLGYDPPAFTRSEIAGLIVNITSGFLDRFYTSVAKDRRFSYFKTGPVGKYLKESDRLLIYREPTTGTPSEGVFGFAEVQRVVEGKADFVWKQLHDENPVMREEEFMRYWGYKRSIVGIVARKFVRIEAIPHQEVREILNLDVNMMNLGHCYVDSGMLARLKLDNRRRAEDLIYHVAISFPSQNRGVAERLSELLKMNRLSVFFDQDEQSTILGTNAMGTLFDVFNHQAAYAVILCSEWTVKSEWAQYELSLALNRDQRERHERDSFVLPVRIDEAEVPFLTTKIFADLRKHSLEEIADQICKRVKHAIR
jgi:GNAT superfamily N-acetyltransferase